MSAGITRRHSSRQHTRDRTNSAGQRQLPQDLQVLKTAWRNLLRCGEDAERNRQVVAPATFRDPRRRQIDSDTPGGEIQPGIKNSGAHSLAAFPHGSFRQPHHRQGGQTIG